MFGLDKKDFYSIIEIFNKYKRKIEWVKIFGSRSRKDYKKTSDIDLVIKFRENSIFFELNNDFYESNLKYTIDLIEFNENLDEKLLKNIEEDGILIYQTDIKGELLMNINKLNEKFEDYKKALNKLKLALEKTPSDDDLYLDGTIQRFEFVYELSWKLMKNYLEYNGIEVNSPRETFRESFKEKLIGDATEWIDMMIDKNRTSHTYNDVIAMDIYIKIRDVYIELFEKFKNVIVNKI